MGRPSRGEPTSGPLRRAQPLEAPSHGPQREVAAQGHRPGSSGKVFRPPAERNGVGETEASGRRDERTPEGEAIRKLAQGRPGPGPPQGGRRPRARGPHLLSAPGSPGGASRTSGSPRTSASPPARGPCPGGWAASGTPWLSPRSRAQTRERGHSPGAQARDTQGTLRQQRTSLWKSLGCPPEHGATRGAHGLAKATQDSRHDRYCHTPMTHGQGRTTEHAQWLSYLRPRHSEVFHRVPVYVNFYKATQQPPAVTPAGLLSVSPWGKRSTRALGWETCWSTPRTPHPCPPHGCEWDTQVNEKRRV